MKFLLKIILVFIFILNCSIALNASSLTSKYYYAKKNYSTSILNNNRQKEIKYLKELVFLGNKLKRNTSLFESELKKYNIIVKSTKSTKKHLFKQKIIKSKSKSNYYNISSINTFKNTIIIKFKHRISKSYIKFIKERKNKFYYNIFDIKGNFKNASPLKLNINGIYNIWTSQMKYKKLRIKLTSQYKLKTIYILKNKTIIIKILNLRKTKYNNIKSKIIHIKTNNNNIFNHKTIVIDPGHGGKDSGAIGPRKRYEKVVVLKIAKKLFNNLKKKGFKVYLTRTSDKFISLKNRTKFANKKHADIFISIHANSISKKKAKKTKGLETYFLSPARSDRSKRIAAKENKSDMNGLSYSSKNTVLSLLNRGKIIASQKLAIDIQSYMLHDLKKYYGTNIEDKGVREGPFWVLVGNQMPSVLIEVGYISNPKESYYLYNNKYQTTISNGIANGIVSYFRKNR